MLKAAGAISSSDGDSKIRSLIIRGVAFLMPKSVYSEPLTRILTLRSTSAAVSCSGWLGTFSEDCGSDRFLPERVTRVESVDSSVWTGSRCLVARLFEVFVVKSNQKRQVSRRISARAVVYWYAR